MIIVFSEHALKRMSERSVSRLLVEKTITEPDKLFKKSDEQFMSVKQFRDRAILVIHTKSDNTVFVLTVISSSKLNKYLK